MSGRKTRLHEKHLSYKDIIFSWMDGSNVVQVIGKPIDHQIRCIHYHTTNDIIAIKFKCCDQYYPCYSCHDETNVVLTNSAFYYNVYWQINGALNVGANSAFMDTALANGAISLANGSSVDGSSSHTAGSCIIKCEYCWYRVRPTFTNRDYFIYRKMWKTKCSFKVDDSNRN